MNTTHYPSVICICNCMALQLQLHLHCSLMLLLTLHRHRLVVCKCASVHLCKCALVHLCTYALQPWCATKSGVLQRFRREPKLLLHSTAHRFVVCIASLQMQQSFITESVVLTDVMHISKYTKAIQW